MQFKYYAKVAAVSGDGAHLKVTDVDRGKSFNVDGTDLIQAAYSADQYETEVKVSQTEVIDVLMRSYNLPFTACFEKACGEERVLRGRLIEPDGRRGRSHVEDLDLPADTKGGRQRQIDHRTLKWLIVAGVKYVAK